MADNMNASQNAVAVTGFGMVTGLAVGVEKNWQELLAGNSAVKPIERFNPEGLRTSIAATIDFDEVVGAENSQSSRVHTLSNIVISEAMAMGQLTAKDLKRFRLYCAIPPLEANWEDVFQLQSQLREAPFEQRYATIDARRKQLVAAQTSLYQQCLPGYMSYRLNAEHGFCGAPVLVQAACATGAVAVKLALQAIRRGEIDRALVLAVESSVSHENIARFSRLSALSTRNDEPIAASRPFDIHRDGFVMGEGAAAMLLERDEAQRPVQGYVLGAGSSTDNFHKTRSDPNASKIVQCMGKALHDAGLSAEDIDSINAHGTSTPENDKTEALGIKLLFGEHAANLKVTANKSMLGHTTNAGGLIEGIVSLKSIQDQKIPPTLNCDEQDAELSLDVVAKVYRSCKVNRVLSNSFAFGGQNESLIFGAEK